MTLILHELPALHWALAGVGIAGVTLALLLLGNRRLGISSGFEDICSLVLPAPYFRRAAVVSGRPWRLPLLGGLVIGGFLRRCSAADGSRRGRSGCSIGIGLGPAGKLAWMFVAGLFIGFGTRLAGGCTSGHGIFGLSNSRAAEPGHDGQFHGGGIVTTQLVYRVVFPMAGCCALPRARHRLRLRPEPIGRGRLRLHPGRCSCSSSLQLYGIIGTAVLLDAPGLWLIKRRGRTLAGRRDRRSRSKPLHRGNMLGGLLFGIGWSLAGMCPGPILVNIGEGKVYALAALAGALVGAGRVRHLVSTAAEAVRAAGAQGRDGRGVNDAGRSVFVSRRISMI